MKWRYTPINKQKRIDHYRNEITMKIHEMEQWCMQNCTSKKMWKSIFNRKNSNKSSLHMVSFACSRAFQVFGIIKKLMSSFEVFILFGLLIYILQEEKLNFEKSKPNPSIKCKSWKKRYLGKTFHWEAENIGKTLEWNT